MSSSYKLLERLGTGAMGEVYKSQDPNLPRFVAIKVLKADLASQPSVVARFKQEAVLAAALNHPNIVTLFGIEQADNTYRIIMEYVEGMSLARLISRMGRQQPRQALDLTRQTADALAEAHSKGLIHRDIKPHNILLSDKGVVKVTDFGLAKALREEGDLTKTGAVLGTPRYMSPEQVSGGPLTFHTDIYSLGVVLYELISGKPAYKDADPLVIMRRIVDEPFPDIRGVVEKIDPMIVKIIGKMTAKNPLDRYPGSARLSADIKSFLSKGVAPLAHEYVLPTSADEAAGPARSPTTASYLVKGDELDFLIHYVHSDETWAEWIELHLKEAGYKVQRGVWDFKRSHQGLRDLVKATEKRTCVISVVSPTYLRALHSEREWSLAFSQGTLTTLPIVVAQCFLGSTFRTVDYLNFCELSMDEAKGILIDEAVEMRGLAGGDAGKALEHMLSTETTVNLQHAIFSVPIAQAQDFAGRAKLLNTMHDCLTDRGGIVSLVQASPNDVGVGLSTLAAEYAYVNRTSYSMVWWLRAQRPETLQADVSALAAEMLLPESKTPQIAAQLAAVRHWLSKNEGWLLILDDVHSPKALGSILPKKLRGHVVLTSPYANWPAGANPQVVPPLDRAESVQFLFNRTQQRNEGAAAALAGALSDIPLALQLAAAYIAVNKLTLDRYIELFLERHKVLWGFQNPPRNSGGVVTTALSLSLERIAGASPGAYGLLKVCSYLSNSEIPIALLSTSAKLFPKPLAKALQDPRQMREGLDLLRRYTLIENADDLLSVHYAVQHLVRMWNESVDDPNQDDTLTAVLDLMRFGGISRVKPTDWIESALSFVKENLPQDPRPTDQWPAFNRIFPHARAVIKHVEPKNLGTREQAAIWERIAQYYTGRLDHNHAAKTYAKAISCCQRAEGARHPEVSRLYKEMAHMHRAQGDLQGARVCYENALAIDQHNYRGAHKSIAACCFNLGGLWTELGDYARARQQYSAALEMDIKLDGKMSADAGRDLTFLGLVSQQLGDLNAAWDYYRRALEISERVYGEVHERVSAAAKNLGGLLHIMGDLANARNNYKRAIQIDMALHGENHPDVAQDYNNLGIVEEGLAMQNSALERYAVAMKINRAVFGENHLKVAINKNNIANILRIQGKTEEAIEYYKAALQVFESALGKNHAHTQTAMRNLSKMKGAAGPS
jgi:serine/threonine protein kinase/tetratricopeptide (TPR) repeat protein